MDIRFHRLTENLGGIVDLLTIDATSITGNPLDVVRYTNTFGDSGQGVQYQGNTFKPYPYKVGSLKRTAKSNKAGTVVNIAESKTSGISQFIDKIGGSLIGAKIFEMRVYGRFLDTGVEPNVSSYLNRFSHKVDYVQDSKKQGELIIKTIDPLSVDLKIPSIQFSAGVPNSPDYKVGVFPAVHRNIAKDV